VSVLQDPQGKGQAHHACSWKGGEAEIGLPGPWHGHRLAHCNPDDLPPELREWRRNHSLGYYIVEASAPREVDAPRLAPDNVVELRSRARVEPHDDAIIVVGAGG